MKTCSKCNTPKDGKEFYSDKRKKDGLRSWCKCCQKEDNSKRESRYNELRKQYRLSNSEEVKANKKLYYENNKEKILTNNASWRQTFKGRLLSYIKSAKRRNIEWNLTEEEFKSFWGLNCSYCNEPIKTIGIDRIKNDEGYTFNNCTPCCSVCNKMKMDLSKNNFLEQIIKIYVNIQRN